MRDLGLKVVSLSSILIGGYEVRGMEQDPDLVDLAGDVRDHGLMHPLEVRQMEDGLHLVAGHRRYAACLLGHLVDVPVHVYDCTEQEALSLSFIENFARRDVTPMEQAARVREVLQAGAMTMDEVAATFRRSLDWVRDQAAMLDWPPALQGAVHARQISVSAARVLAQITDESYRDSLVGVAIDNGVTARTCEAWVASWRAMQPLGATVALGAAGPAAGPAPLAPVAVCMGCRGEFRPDGMVPVYLCPGCVAVMRAHGVGGPRS